MANGQQTSVDSTIGRATAGLIADSGFDKVVRSYASQEASAEIPFGVMVGQGANENGALLLALITDRVIGVTTKSHAYVPDVEVGTVGLKPGTTIGVLTKGRIWVRVEGAVTPASTVHVRAVATGTEIAGSFRATADGTDTIDVSAFCRFVSNDYSGLAQLELDITNRRA